MISLTVAAVATPPSQARNSRSSAAAATTRCALLCCRWRTPRQGADMLTHSSAKRFDCLCSVLTRSVPSHRHPSEQVMLARALHGPSAWVRLTVRLILHGIALRAAALRHSWCLARVLRWAFAALARRCSRCAKMPCSHTLFCFANPICRPEFLMQVLALSHVQTEEA